MGSYVELMKTLKKDNNIPIILWGIGDYYYTVKDFIKNVLAIDYIYDKKWANNINEFDGYPVISLGKLKEIDKCIIISCTLDKNTEKSIKKEASKIIENVKIYSLKNIIPIGRFLRKKEIIAMSIGNVYQDFYGNSIEYDTLDSLNRVHIKFFGSNAKIKLGRNIWVDTELNIICGNNTKVQIGNSTSFVKTTLHSSYGEIDIGNDCMFSSGIFVRNHDNHFIFDAETGDRINYSRKVKIKDHVWVGQNSILLAGFSIGNGAIIGAGSISSSIFPDKVVIAGSPARIIREGIIWHRDSTWRLDYNNIKEIQ